MLTTCKLKLTEIRSYEGSAQRFFFTAVSADGVEENKRFHKHTPSGSFEMTVDNKYVQDQFKVGECYYVDFRPYSTLPACS